MFNLRAGLSGIEFFVNWIMSMPQALNYTLSNWFIRIPVPRSKPTTNTEDCIWRKWMSTISKVVCFSQHLKFMRNITSTLHAIPTWNLYCNSYIYRGLCGVLFFFTSNMHTFPKCFYNNRKHVTMLNMYNIWYRNNYSTNNHSCECFSGNFIFGIHRMSWIFCP